MFTSVIRKGQNALGSLKNRLAPLAADFRLRQQSAFEILHPRVQIVKRSPTAQITVGAIITTSILTGHWGTAAAVAGCWVGSRPLTHAVASGVGAIGLVDAKLVAAIERLQIGQAEVATTP